MLQIYIKNNSMKNNVNIKLLSYYLFILYNFNINSKIINTKKNIISYKIRKNVCRGLFVYFKNYKNLKLIKFLNFQKCKIKSDTKISSSLLIGNIHNFFNNSNLKSLVINDNKNTTDVKPNLKLNNVYNFSFSLNLLFLKKFNILSKESFFLLNQINV